MSGFKKIIKNYLTNFKHKYMFIDKNNKYTKKFVTEKIKFFEKKLSENWGKEKVRGVAILLDRDIDYLSLIFATWICNGFYLPLSNEMPENNIRQQLRDSGVNLIVYKKNGILVFKKIRKIRNKFIEKNHRNIAYVIFTSGSTGKKKGVCISNSGLQSYFQAIKIKFYRRKKFKSLVISGELTFDITLADFIFALLFKSTIAITENSKNFISLINIINTHKVEAMYLVPSALNKLIEINSKIGKNYLKSIKHINLGGENLSPALVDKIKSKFQKVNIYNFYGPTEFTINCLCHMIENKRYEEIPIGKPLKGVRIYINKKDPRDDFGELYLSGNQLMLGYVNYKNNIVNVHGKNYYPTGDVVKINKKHELIFIGRAKDYIKVDGYRISLTRIENIILKNLNLPCKVTLIKNKVFLIVEVNKKNKLSINNKLINIFNSFLESYEKPYKVIFINKFIYLDSGKLDITGTINKIR